MVPVEHALSLCLNAGSVARRRELVLIVSLHSEA